jgi:hypothetical protein
MYYTVRQWLKAQVLKRSLGRRIYLRFCRARTLVLVWLLYAGWLSAKRLDEIVAEKHITIAEVIAALDRIPHRYSLAERMRFLKILKRHE